MTLKTNARLAGFMYLFYFVTGLTGMFLFNKATGSAAGTAAQLASLAQHAQLVRVTVVIGRLNFLVPVVLAVALYTLTRDQDRELALIALCCRVSEGMMNAFSAGRTLGLLSVAAAAATTAAAAPDAAAAHTLGALLLKQDGGNGGFIFAVGSTLFCYLFLRARSIPVPLAWLGVLGSILLVVGLPLELLGFLHGPVTYFMWIPMAVFEVAFGLWLLIKGFNAQDSRRLPQNVVHDSLVTSKKIQAS
jgi:hypothetical protein